MALDTSSIDIYNQYGVDQQIVQYIQEASQLTGVNFSYLLAKAAQESSFNPKAKANLSSATGIFQFTENTWLEHMYRYGEKYGYGNWTKSIVQKKNGFYTVKDPYLLKQILNLRTNPRISALMAAEFAKTNQVILADYFKRPVGASELYLAHFMGAGGTLELLEALRRNPKQSAARLFPEAAKSNPRIFYNGKKKHRSVAEVYRMINSLFEQTFKKFSNLPVEMLARIPEVISRQTTSFENPITQKEVVNIDEIQMLLEPKKNFLTEEITLSNTVISYSNFETDN